MLPVRVPTTLGQAIESRLNGPHFDTDAYYWLPTDPPFVQPRDIPLHQNRLMDDLTAHDAWVLSGSLCGWGDIAIPLFDIVIYLWIPPELRLQRLRQREWERYGERIALGGDMYEKSQTFLKWAAAYDDGGLDIRSRAMHEQWLSQLPCPVFRLEGAYSMAAGLEVLATAISR